MKFKDRLIGILQLFVCVAIPGTIYSSFKFSGHPLGGLETLVLYAPFVCFYLRAEIKRKRRRSSQEPKDNSIPITPEMLAASASENEPETNDTASAFDDELEPEDTMTREERLNQIKICRERAVSDYAQGNMSAKEFTDICALLKHMELEADIPVPEADKSGQQSSAKETYLIENDDGFLVRVPASKLDAWEKADHKAPLTPEEEQFIEKLLDSIYGPNANENEPPEVMSEINGLPNQPEVPPLYRQDRAEEKPIGYIPHSGHISHSGHAPIP